MATGIVQGGSAILESFTANGAGSSSARGKNWLPNFGVSMGKVKITKPDGSSETHELQLDPQWYRFFNEVAQNRLGGVDGPTILDVTQSAVAVAQSVSAVAVTLTAVSQQSNAAAVAAIATKQVLTSSPTQAAVVLAAKGIVTPNTR